ncbi:MAG: YlmC/YmxH family sporulation protein [Oscillospiraceae bacterium]|nr:YlmC/YmxH family sporulation protein [Oscillospiraceae bacterium]
MICNFTELRGKTVINKIDGARLGTVCDIEVDTDTGKLCAILVLGKGRIFSALTETIKVSWSNIDVVGEDTILVSRTKDQRKVLKVPESPESEFYKS